MSSTRRKVDTSTLTELLPGSRHIKNLEGQVYGRLRVLGFAGKNRYGSALWKCQCSCGNTTVVPTNQLNSGNTRSCGCLQRDISSKFPHAHLAKVNITHGLSKTKLYAIWNTRKYIFMKNPTGKFHEPWLNFQTFYRWAKLNGYEEGMTIQVVDPEKGYVPDNCRVVPMEGGAYKRNARNISYNGKTQTLTKWSRELGINISTLRRKLEQADGDMVKALEDPVRKYFRKPKKSKKSKKTRKDEAD